MIWIILSLVLMYVMHKMQETLDEMEQRTSELRDMIEELEDTNKSL